MKIYFKKVFIYLFISIFLFVFCINFFIKETYAASGNIGQTYSTVFDFGAPENYKLGDTTWQSATSTTKELDTCSQIFNPQKKNFTDKVIIMYGFTNTVSMPIQEHWQSFRYLAAGDVYEYNMTLSSSISKTYEKESTTTTSLRYGSSTSLEIDALDFAKLGLSTYSEVNSSVSNSFRYSTTLTWDTSTSETLTRYVDETAYYMAETRGMFEVAVVGVFQANLEMINYTQHGSWIFKYHTWDYRVKNYTLLEQYVVYSYIPNTSYSGIFKYRWNGAVNERRFMYIDHELENVCFY